MSSWRLRRPWPRWGAAALAGLAVVSSACQATIRIGVNANGNGGGRVSAAVVLDREATQAVPDLGQQLRTSDLLKSGWNVQGPTPTAGGGSIVTVSKAFRTPSEEAQIVRDLSGPTGPFHDFHLRQHRSFFSTRTTFSGRVDLTCGLRCFGDAQLQQQLGGDLGLDPTRLQQQAGVPLSRLFTFEVAVRLPGSLRSSNAPVHAGNRAAWQPRLGDAATLTATARAIDAPRTVLVTAGPIILALSAGVLVRRRRNRRHRRA